MDVDWEIEVGGGAPVIEAHWTGFIDLRRQPERIGEIAEASAFPPLARLLLLLNGPQSSVWTSKCDLWEPEPAAFACYIDLLSRESVVFRRLPQAEAFCRRQIAALDSWMPLTAVTQRSDKITAERDNSNLDASLMLVVRQAIAQGIEGYGVTAYLSTKQATMHDARQALASAFAAAANTLSGAAAPQNAGSKLK